MRFMLVVAILSLGQIAHGKPDRAPQPQPESPIPCIAGLCDYGVISQSGRSFTIRGHHRWNGDGWISPAGKLQIIWIDSETNARGAGVYDLCDDCIIGRWAWVSAGGLGRVFPDRFGRYIPPHE